MAKERTGLAVGLNRGHVSDVFDRLIDFTLLA